MYVKRALLASGPEMITLKDGVFQLNGMVDIAMLVSLAQVTVI
jgi:hypothetical protein